MRCRLVALAFLVAVGLPHWVGAQDTNRREMCQKYVDSGLHMQFPTTVDDLCLTSRLAYGRNNNDYSLRYEMPAETEGPMRERHLDVYVFTREDDHLPDGVSAPVQRELDNFVKTIRHLAKTKNYLDINLSGLFSEGKLPKSNLAFQWTSCTFRFKEKGTPFMSVAAIWAWRGRFFKLRYSEPLAEGRVPPCEKLMPAMEKILAAMDECIGAALTAAKVDVYALDNPTNRLMALRRKWLGVEERISAYDMPDFFEDYKRVLAAQRCWSKRPQARAHTFLKWAQLDIELKIEPPIAYYNYACALSLMGEKEEAFLALEQAVAAGLRDTAHMAVDDDLASLRSDSRFAKLIDAASAVERDWLEPLNEAVIFGNRLHLDDSNVLWEGKWGLYEVDVVNATSNTLIYLDHGERPEPPPATNMVGVTFAEPFWERGLATGWGNFSFLNPQMENFIPTLLGCTAVRQNVNPTNDVESFPAVMAGVGDVVNRQRILQLANVLGVYAAGRDYGADGIDRLFGWSSVALVCPDAQEVRDMLRLCAEAWQVMDPTVRQKGGVRQLVGLIRRGQKDVADEAAFLTPTAQRPVVSVANLDREKVLSLARGLKKPYPEIPFLTHVGLESSCTTISDLREEPFDNPIYAYSGCHAVYVARGAEKRTVYNIQVEHCDEGQLVWKVLQGDADKIHFQPRDTIREGEETNDVMEISCDYHAAFDVTLPNGEKIKSTRVDLGCFHVVDGVASVPVVVSIYFMPAETRTYGVDGLLKEIDYTKPQIANWRPSFCPKANFRDEFHWTSDRQLAGWTRTLPDGKKEEFTRDGLVILTRDKLGRPQDVRRSMNMTWLQDVEPFAATGKVARAQFTAQAIRFDERVDEALENTLAWQYTYANDQDVFGKPEPKPIQSFRSRPELCCRADFSPQSGFAFPVLNQIALGRERQAKYKHDLVGAGEPEWELPSDYGRSDSRFALKEEGLVVPKVLKKMQFCPWVSTTNDLWQVDMDDFEGKIAEDLREQGDGAYRIYTKSRDGEERGTYQSINESQWIVQNFAEHLAYRKLDAVYPRCRTEFVEAVMGALLGEDSAKSLLVADGDPVDIRQLPENILTVAAMWRITRRLYLVATKSNSRRRADQRYTFVDIDEKEGRVAWVSGFVELPSRAIGNTVLRAQLGEEEALNNMAVLQYCGLAEPDCYSEDKVTDLLKRAAQKGCRTAEQNLKVLHYNRGE